MALKDIVSQKEAHDIAGTTVEIHGLSMSDLSALLDHHRDALASFFEADEPSVDLIAQFEDATCAIIAQAAGEPKAVEQVRNIPLGDQLKILKSVWILTNISLEDLGNMMSGVLEGLRKVTAIKDGIMDSKTGSET